MNTFVPSFTTRKDKTVPKPPMILFAMPSFDGNFCHEFVWSWTQTLSALGGAQIPSGSMMACFDPYLSKVRNRLATDFLLDWPMATHLFFLDADIGWPGHKVVEFIQRDLDVIGGVYPKKRDNPEYPFAIELDADGLPIRKDGLYRVKMAPTGFLCIKRHVLEKLAAQSGTYFDTTGQNGRPQFNIFDMGWFMPDLSRPEAQGGRAGEYWGEDYYFCRRWRDMGGEVWIDPDIEFSHRGSRAWHGSLKPSLELWETEQRVAHEAKTRGVSAEGKEESVA